MLHKILKGLLTALLLVFMGVMNVIQIGIELVYQLVRLVRRGFNELMNRFIDKIKPIYNGNVRRPKEIIEDDNDITFIEFEC